MKKSYWVILTFLALTLIFVITANLGQKPDQNINATINWGEIRKDDITKVGGGWGDPKLLSFSTSGWEEGGYISHDGNTFYFDYINIDAFRFLGIAGQTSGDKTPIGPLLDTNKQCTLGTLGAFNCGQHPRFDMFFTEKTANGWTTPKPHPLTLVRPARGIVLVNNNKAYFYTSFDEEWKGDDIAYSEKINGKWGPAIRINSIDTDYSEVDPYVNPQDTEMFFWSDKPADFGGKNIYHSTKVNGEWQAPKILSKPINSDQDDMQTFLFENILYFSSGKGDGRIRIYKSERDGDSWRPPELVIESKLAVGEPSLTDDGNKLYFEQIFTDGKGNFNPEMMYIERK